MITIYIIGYLLFCIICYYISRYYTKKIYKSWDWEDIIFFGIYSIIPIANIISCFVQFLSNKQKEGVRFFPKPPKWL